MNCQKCNFDISSISETKLAFWEDIVSSRETYISCENVWSSFIQFFTKESLQRLSFSFIINFPPPLSKIVQSFPRRSATTPRVSIRAEKKRWRTEASGVHTTAGVVWHRYPL
ncbi:hypothetical protein I7I50_02827 [Histoplasma capsulatum G186AR]|uniref:Uncharacterized protein n=1 Tax=Ajellomyces capsulatus TaxID=5037 RepID=A0A8H7Z2T5_AJECA|nr:hypothetical protein I7I52_00507 [Histoplasma capsulatum]QSS71832.1 hypothetical protein I7I50_02827 [Histoplasma capsulatum G186AR]